MFSELDFPSAWLSFGALGAKEDTMEIKIGTDQTTKDQKPSEPETPHKHTTVVVTTIASCAFGSFVLGAVLGAPWPGAVAACGLSVMGVGVAYVMLHRA